MVIDASLIYSACDGYILIQNTVNKECCLGVENSVTLGLLQVSLKKSETDNFKPSVFFIVSMTVKKTNK